MRKDDKKMEQDIKYSCDVCGDRLSWDNVIIWLNSSFGVCPSCYDDMSEDEKEEIRNK